jgi:intracellular septation protein A
MPAAVLDLPLPKNGRSSHAAELATGRVLELPSVRSVVRRVLTYVIEVTVVPSVLFYVSFVNLGLRPALLIALAWSSTALVRRIVTRQRIPATLVLSCVIMSSRTLVSWMSGSVFLYFLQPVLTTLTMASFLLLSVWLGKPFVQKALVDYVPSLPSEWRDFPRIERFFRRATTAFGVMYLCNVCVTGWALLTTGLGSFMLISKGGGTALTAATVGVTIVLFRRALKREGISVRYAPHRPAQVVALHPVHDPLPAAA